MRLPVLDHGYVELCGTLGDDAEVIRAARMSTGGNFNSWDTDSRLLEFLYKNSHMTPFEMCEASFEVKAPIMVFREWHRHRTFSYNEMSARYTQLPDTFYVPEVSRVCTQSTQNKQSSGEQLLPGVAADCVQEWALEQGQAYKNYSENLAAGIERGLARLNLPVSIYSVMRVKGNLRNWLQFLTLRCAPNAQWEIRQYALTIYRMLEQKFPRTLELWRKYTYQSFTLSSDQIEVVLKELMDTGDTEVSKLRQMLIAHCQARSNLESFDDHS